MRRFFGLRIGILPFQLEVKGWRGASAHFGFSAGLGLYGLNLEMEESLVQKTFRLYRDA